MYSQHNATPYVYIWEAWVMTTTILRGAELHNYLVAVYPEWAKLQGIYSSFWDRLKRHSLPAVLIDFYDLDGASLTKDQKDIKAEEQSPNNFLPCSLLYQMLIILFKNFQSIRYLYCLKADAKNRRVRLKD